MVPVCFALVFALDLIPCMSCLILPTCLSIQIEIEDEVAAEIGTVEQAVEFIAKAA